MGLREFLQRRMERSKRIKDRQNELQIEKLVQDRMKSPEERELLNHLERKRQEKIKEQVKSIRQQNTKDFLLTGLTNKKNIFKNHPRILDLNTRVIERSNMFFR